MERIKLKPHLQKIVNYIRKHGSVTVREATLSKELNTVELRKRISEINGLYGPTLNFYIASEWETNPCTKTRYKRYFLAPKLCK